MSKSKTKLHLYSLGILFPLIGGLVSLLLLTRLMTPAIFGKYSLLLAVVEVLQTVVFQWHRMTVLRYYDGAVKSSSLGNLLAAAHYINILLLLSTIAISILLMYVLDVEWWLVSVLTICKAMSLFAQEIARISEKVTTYILVSFVQAVGILVLPSSAYLITKSLSFTTIALAIAYGISVFPAKDLFKLNIVKLSDFKGEMFAFKKYGVPLIYGFIAASLLSKFDKIIIGAYSSMDQLGGYAAIGTIANGIAGAALGVIVSPFYPKILREFNKDGWASAKLLQGTISTIVLSIAIYLFCTLTLSRSEVIHVLLATSYWHSAELYFVPTLLFVLLFGLKAHVVDQVFHVQAKTNSLVKVNIVCGVLACLISIEATSKFGPEGFLYVMVISTIISIILQNQVLDDNSRPHVEYIEWAKVAISACASFFLATCIPHTLSDVINLMIKTGVFSLIFCILMYLFDFLKIRSNRHSLLETLRV